LGVSAKHTMAGRDGGGGERMAEQENKVLVERLVNGLNSRDAHVFDDVYTRDYVGHDPDRSDTRRFDDLQHTLTGLLARTFPDGHYTTETLIAEGDRVAWQWSFVGTHKGPLLGMPSTGRKIAIRGATLFRVVEGRIAEDWVYRDTAGILRQMGVLPPVSSGRRR
jgi:steroid delta-isomerase-like uncharacterized protein